ncbi:MAG: hypothetical protein ACRCSB_03345 [Bacteroidales bacterium]
MSYRLPLYSLLILAIMSCSQSPWRDDEPLARVGHRTLYISDLKGVFPPQVTAEDSLRLLNNYVATWVKNQLFLKLAEKNLDAQQKDVRDLLEEYRISLLVHRYEESYIEQQADTIIEKKAIERFYQKNHSLFTTQQAILKGRRIRIPKGSVYYNSIKSVFSSTKPSDVQLLKSFCAEASIQIEEFTNQWISLEDFLYGMPKEQDYEKILLKQKSLEVSDAAYTYLIAVQEYLPRKSISPIEYEYQNIKLILLNQRKKEILKKMQAGILKNAKQSKYVKIFINE